MLAIDWAVRRATVNQLSKHLTNDKDGSTTIVNDICLPKLQVIYYLGMGCLSIIMFSLTVLQILVSNTGKQLVGLQVPNFYHGYEINARVIQSFIGILMLCALHHALAIIIGLVALLVERFVTYEQLEAEE